MTKLASMVRDVEDDPSRVVIVDGDRSYTRREAIAAVDHCAAELRRLGVRPHERILAVVDHDPRGLFFLAAASALGLKVVMPYNLANAAWPEWSAIAEQAGIGHIVLVRSDAAGLDLLQAGEVPVVRLGRFESGPGLAGAFSRNAVDDPVESFLVLFTSGTSGAPKAVSVSEELVCRRIASVSRQLQFRPGSRTLMSGLLNNTTGVIFAFGALANAATVVFPTSGDVSRWPAEIAAGGVTHIMLRPAAMRTFVDALEAEPRDLSSLQVVAYGAAITPRAVLERGRRLLDCSWVQGYGLSESYGPFCWLDEAAHQEQRYRTGAYCVGTPDDTVEVALLPIEGHPRPLGEVALRSDGIMEGYYDVATDRVAPLDEWFRTGDIAEWSPRGDLLLKGRLNGSVLSENGHRIYPEEIEAVLSDVPGVDDVAVLGITAEGSFAERSVACVHGPLAGRGVAEIQLTVGRTLVDRLSPEKWPDFIYPKLAPFAKSANGKTTRSELKAAIVPAELIPFGASMSGGTDDRS